MKAKELRIGNLVSFHRGVIRMVDFILPDRVSVNAPLVHYPIELKKIKPIPLTEEWLLKFGFEKSKTQMNYFTKNNNIGISYADNKFRFIQGNFVCQLVLRDIEYVHQLQNLFFALTGKELTENN